MGFALSAYITPQSTFLILPMTRPVARHVKRRAFKLKSPPAGTFARTLWSILRTGNDNLTQAAARLRATPGELSSIIHGRRTVTSHYIQCKKWPEILGRHYPVGWQRHAARFEAHAEGLKHHAGRQPRMPDDRGSFGNVLWKILGGHAIDVRHAAQRLGLPVHRLSEIIHSHKPLSQRFVMSRQWDRVLAEHYTAAWQAHRETFFTRLEALAAYPGESHRVSKVPADRSGFGYVLWLVLGGKTMDRERASELLQVSGEALSAILHGRTKPTQRQLAQKRWRELLAQHHPQGWRDYGEVFETRAAQLKTYRGARGPARTSKDELAAILRMMLGTETADLNKAATLLRIRPGMLRKILSGRIGVQPRLIRNKQWPQILAQHYPVLWHHHRRAFLAAIDELERPHKIPRTSNLGAAAEAGNLPQ
jgi:plasmid maintenance system antidote protein VapI